MRAGLRQRIAQLLIAQPRGDEGAAGCRAHRLDRLHVGAAIEPERHDARGMGRRRADQAIAMRTIMRNDRGAARLESRKDLALGVRSEEHTSELQSLMRHSYAV